MSPTVKDLDRKWSHWRPVACIVLIIVLSFLVNYGVRFCTHFKSFSIWASSNALSLNFGVRFIHYLLWLGSANLLSPKETVRSFFYSLGLYKRIQLSGCYYSLLAVVLVFIELSVIKMGGRPKPNLRKNFYNVGKSAGCSM